MADRRPLADTLTWLAFAIVVLLGLAATAASIHIPLLVSQARPRADVEITN
jgi:hypothetical protein